MITSPELKRLLGTKGDSKGTRDNIFQVKNR